MTSDGSHLIGLRPRSDTLFASRNYTVLCTGRNGFISDEPWSGLIVHQTRMLSRYRYLIDGQPPQAVALSNIEQHTWLGYYIAPPPEGQLRSSNPTQQTIELRLWRSVGAGFHEDVYLTNYTQKPVEFRLQLEVDADFADQREAKNQKRQQQGEIQRAWRRAERGSWELAFDYRAEHHYDHQGNTGTARIHRGFTLRIDATADVTYRDGRLEFSVQLAPQATWHTSLDLIPFTEDAEGALAFPGHDLAACQQEYDQKCRLFLSEATAFRTPESQTLAPVVIRTLEQAKRDLAALRLYEFDHDEHSWFPAAGIPMYVARFGRDPLVTGWQAALTSPDLMRGILAELPRSQGTAVNDWRDEQPGRMIHQMQDGPLSALNFDPLGLYYGSITTSVLYAAILSTLWLWTADEGRIRPLLAPALKGLRWLDEYGDIDGDGFYEYETHSKQGLKNQGWKDSGDAIVYEDGSQVSDPIAPAESQALAYVAKVRLAEVLWWLGEKEEAKRLEDQAKELKQRFNDTFWMEDEGTFALGLDPDKRLIRSISSDAGACLAAGIVDQSRAQRTADRLMADDLFSGWGIRTLSSRHPAYDPFSYQRGSIWPSENGILALAFMRYGLHDYVERLCRAQFEAAELFDYCRLPEVFAGHPRDAEHPFPGLYPDANWPQAWSSSAVFCFIQALLGLFPFAPLHTLVVDPHLPEWLPEITLTNLHVGPAVAAIRFFRQANGKTSYEVLDQRGTLHVVWQPSPWSLQAGFGERVKDFLTSLLPGK